MAFYKIVKYCRLCKKRFVVDQGQSKRYHCDDCEKKTKEEQR